MKEVLDHKTTRTCVGFDIGIVEMKIDEKRKYPVLRFANDLAPSHSGQPRDSPPNKEKWSESRRHDDVDDERYRLCRLEREQEQERRYGSKRL